MLTLNSLSETTSPTYSRMKSPETMRRLVRTPQPLLSVMKRSSGAAHSCRWMRWFLHRSLHNTISYVDDVALLRSHIHEGQGARSKKFLFPDYNIKRD